MGDASTTPDAISPFIERWTASGAAERANYQLFLAELCDVLGVERPHPATEDPHRNAYVFEKRVPSAHGTTNFIDRLCCKKSCRIAGRHAETNRPGRAAI